METLDVTGALLHVVQGIQFEFVTMTKSVPGVPPNRWRMVHVNKSYLTFKKMRGECLACQCRRCWSGGQIPGGGGGVVHLDC